MLSPCPPPETDAYSVADMRSIRKMGQIAMEDLSMASKLLRKALRLREKYMDTALQSFPNVTRRFIDPSNACPYPGADASSLHSSQADGLYR